MTHQSVPSMLVSICCVVFLVNSLTPLIGINGSQQVPEHGRYQKVLFPWKTVLIYVALRCLQGGGGGM